jgi:hypothetical protein
MRIATLTIRLRSAIVAGAAAIVLGAGVASAQEVKVVLSGSQEIPPVTTPASGTGTVAVGPDKSVSGSVTIAGMVVTVAHIHVGPAGTNGPIVVPLVKTSEYVWAIPPGSKFTDAQFDSFKAGNLYFNVHSDAYKAGEIRGQIKP